MISYLFDPVSPSDYCLKMTFIDPILLEDQGYPHGWFGRSNFIRFPRSLHRFIPFSIRLQARTYPYPLLALSFLKPSRSCFVDSTTTLAARESECLCDISLTNCSWSPISRQPIKPITLYATTGSMCPRQEMQSDQAIMAQAKLLLT